MFDHVPTEEEIRLECLRLAFNSSGESSSPNMILSYANDYYNWVKGKGLAYKQPSACGNPEGMNISHARKWFK